MASYSQWARSRRASRLMWVCGPEPVLREEVISCARSEASETVSMSARYDSELAIWDAAAQQAAPGTIRLLIVREAGRLKQWDSFERIAAAWRELPDNWLLLETDSEDFPRAGGELAPHCARIRDSSNGQLICCSSPAGDALVQWTASQLPGQSLVSAGHLLGVVAGAGKPDLHAVADAAAKLRLLGRADEALIRAVADIGAGGDFADMLVLAGPRPALRALSLLGGSDIGAAIGQLNFLLGTLSALHRAAAEQLTAKDISMRLGIGTYLQRRYKNAAAGYTALRTARCGQLLAMADSYWRSGAREGVLEAVAALW